MPPKPTELTLSVRKILKSGIVIDLGVPYAGSVGSLLKTRWPICPPRAGKRPIVSYVEVRKNGTAELVAHEVDFDNIPGFGNGKVATKPGNKPTR